MAFPFPVSPANEMIASLQHAVDTRARNATIAVSGSVEIIELTETQDNEIPPVFSPPIQIRYEGNGEHGVLTLPTHDVPDSIPGEYPWQQPPLSESVQRLMKACSLAPTGREDVAIHGDSYRRVLQLSADSFLTSFDPYATGIVDVIAQGLLLNPGTLYEEQQALELQNPVAMKERDAFRQRAMLEQESTIERGIMRYERGIHLQPYKLNVYQPGDMVRSHHDPPKSGTHFGRLVISLPVTHLGGKLKIRQHDDEFTFESAHSKEDEPRIKWVAFYGDCELELLPVQSGNRITLTYNLFTNTRSGRIAGRWGAFAPEKLPLSKQLSKAVGDSLVFPEGRVLAIHLTHRYAHTSDRLNFLPRSLKGSDMIIYEAACAAGLQCLVRPYFRYDNNRERDGFGRPLINTKHYVGDEFKAHVDKGEFAGRYKDDALQHIFKNFMFPYDTWDFEDAVLWLNRSKPQNREKQMTVVKVPGDEGIVDHQYTHAVLFIRIPKAEDRSSNDTSEHVFQDILESSGGEILRPGNAPVAAGPSTWIPFPPTAAFQAPLPPTAAFQAPLPPTAPFWALGPQPQGPQPVSFAQWQANTFPQLQNQPAPVRADSVCEAMGAADFLDESIEDMDSEGESMEGVEMIEGNILDTAEGTVVESIEKD